MITNLLDKKYCPQQGICKKAGSVVIRSSVIFNKFGA